MQRRKFITLLGGTAVAWPLAARAQQPKMPVIGVLATRGRDDDPQLLAAFRQGLNEAGYVDARIPVLVGNPIRLASEVESGDACLMRGVCSLIWLALVGLFHSRVSLEAEILALRHQLNVLRRISPKKPTFTIIDRLVFAGLYRLAPGIFGRPLCPDLGTNISGNGDFKCPWSSLFIASKT